MLRYAFGLIFGFTQLLQGMGCSPETVVHTPSGVMSLASLHAGDCLVSGDFPSDTLSTSTISAIAHFTVSASVNITLGDETIVVAPLQRFYVISERCWIPAVLLTSRQVIRTASGTITIDKVNVVAGPTNVMTLFVEDIHTFFIGKHQILTHNNLGVAAGAVELLFAILSGPIFHISTYILVGLTVVAAWTGIEVLPRFVKKLLCKENFYYVHTAQVGGVLGKLVAEAKKNGVEPPEQLIYDPAPYHPIVPIEQLSNYIAQHGCGRKSPCPPRDEGQAILQYLSFPIPGIKHRLAWVARILIMFHFTGDAAQGKVYHGNYHLSSVHELGTKCMEELQNQRIINGKGKFL